MEILNTSHDKGYKWLLSSREIFMQLLNSFVKESWVKEIDANKLKRTDKSFIAKDFLEKEADLVYEVNLRGQTVVFYILLELQRKVDFSMPYRLLNYMSGIWQNHLNLLPKEVTIEQKDVRLPAIIPIVLYNGEKPWTAPRSFREMLGAEHLFGNHLLNFTYILLDVNRYTDKELLEISNTIGAAFLLDKNSRNPEGLRKLLKKLFRSLQNATETESMIFNRWLRYIIQPRLSPHQQNIFIEEFNQLNNEEVRKMVFENFEKSLDAIEEKGRLKGKREGKQEGKQETALEMLRDKVDASTVAKYTKLPLEKIQDLMKKL